MPCETVNQILLDAEYAVHTASFALEVQRGSSPGAPKASPCPAIHLYRVSRSVMPVEIVEESRAPVRHLESNRSEKRERAHCLDSLPPSPGAHFSPTPLLFGVGYPQLLHCTLA